MANEQTHNTYLPGYTEVEHHKLRTAENCSAYLLPTLRSAYAIKPNLRFLDVGAGSGTITTSLARYMPKGTVIAFDLSADILSQAAAHAKTEGVTNIEFQTGSVYALPFDDDSFDIVHTHQMLCHLDTPLAALTEMLRVCRPGGTVAIRECDMRMWSFWPQLPALEKFLDIQLVTHEAGGGTNVAGPQLISWALKCGVPRERVKASMGTWCYSEGWERRVWGA